MGIMYPRLHGLLSKTGVFNCNSVNWTTDRFALYEFENNANLGEDTQGSLDLTNANGVTQVAGKVGFAANFVRASLQYFEVPFTGATFDLTGDWSISCWAKISDTGGNDIETIFRVIEPTLFTTVIDLSLQQPTRIRSAWRDRDTNDVINIKYDGIVPDIWHHYVLIKRETTPGLYMDGVDTGVRGGNVGSIPTLTQNVTDKLRVFRGATVYADGGIDQFVIWNRALSDDEVSCLYNSGSGIVI
jgi:hypothetical protein